MIPEIVVEKLLYELETVRDNIDQIVIG